MSVLNFANTPAAAAPVWIAGNPGSVINPVPPTAPPATIAGGSNWNSGPILSIGRGGIAAGATLSQTGTLTLQRYIDKAATIAIGSAVTAAMTANTPATVDVVDGLPCGSFTIVVANTSGSTGNLTGVAILMTAS